MRAAIYLRVSDKKQESTNQLQPLKDLALALGHTITNEYVDHFSAGQGKLRKQFEQMFEDARVRKFDIILFWSLDRFSREGVLETLSHLQKLNSYKVGWKSYTEQYLDSTGIFREAVIAIIATVAKQERVRISERVKAGMQRAYEAGGCIGRKPVDVDPKIIDGLVAEGLSVRLAQEKLASMGIVISRGSVHSLMKPSNKGMAI